MALSLVSAGLGVAAVAVALVAGCSSSGDKPSSGSGKAEPAAAAQTAMATETATAAADAPAPADGLVPASQLEYTEMKVVADERSADAKENHFRFVKIWGEVKNKSPYWIERIWGDIRYFDAAGNELSLASIGSAVRKDVGDKAPGEDFSAEVEFIAPGASAPVHHLRNFAALGGAYASHKVTLRPARIATKHPEGVIEGMKDEVATVANESLTDASPHEHRVISGTIRNKGAMGCRHPGVVVGFYDGEGKLAATSEGDAKGEIATVVPTGGTAPFKVFTLVGFDDAWKAKAPIKTWVSCSEPY
jgi:hypothetical protein